MENQDEPVIKKAKIIWPKRRCVIQDCLTVAGCGLPLHRFPRDEDNLLKWIEATGVTNVSEQTIICGLHFRTADYYNVDSIRRKLRKSAVPSLNLRYDCEDHIENETEFSDSDETLDSGDARSSEVPQDFNQIESDIDKLNQVDCDEAPDLCIRKVIEAEQNCSLIVHEDTDDHVMQDIGHELNQITLSREPTISENKVMVDKQTQTDKTSFMNLLKTDNHLKAFTGINYNVLNALVKAIEILTGNQQKKSSTCTLQEKIVLTLMKLKLCLSHECLGVLFDISRSTSQNYFVETIGLLHCVLEEAIYFPSKDEIVLNLPVCFKDYADTRIVLDCTEIPVETTRCLQCRMKMYSHYKGRQTLKFLIGIAPSGLITFCSDCFGGRSSDKSIFVKSGLLEKLIPGRDAIMVDKGFVIDNECAQRNVKLYRPPFASSTQQMSKEDSLKTKKIAAARVHVERIMERLKNFSILKSVLDFRMTKYIDKIIVIICGLVNLSAPILSQARYC